MTPEETARSKGRLAALAGYTLHHNPYLITPNLYLEWLAAWTATRMRRVRVTSKNYPHYGP